MKLKNRMTPEEFCGLDEDIKYDVYTELYESLTHTIEQNERQYRLLELKDKFIIKLKEIIIKIVENMKGGE